MVCKLLQADGGRWRAVNGPTGRPGPGRARFERGKLIKLPKEAP